MTKRTRARIPQTSIRGEKIKTTEKSTTEPIVDMSTSRSRTNEISLELKHPFIGNVTKKNKEQSNSLNQHETIKEQIYKKDKEIKLKETAIKQMSINTNNQKYLLDIVDKTQKTN